jgi:hypothetical protein
MPDPILQGGLDHLNLTPFAPLVRGGPVMGAKYLVEMGQVFDAAIKCNISKRAIGAQQKPPRIGHPNAADLRRCCLTSRYCPLKMRITDPDRA